MQKVRNALIIRFFLSIMLALDLITTKKKLCVNAELITNFLRQVFHPIRFANEIQKLELWVCYDVHRFVVF